jgi:hypothetical protein
MTTTPTPSPQLVADVPCLRCGYNLRGLAPDGQCPECGHLVHMSVLAWDEDRRRMLPLLLESDPRWIRNVAEGAAIALIVFVLMVTLAALPDWMYAWRTTPRKWTLGIACTMVVLSWAAAWKLTVPEQVPVPERVREHARRTLRWSATIYATAPFIFGLMPAVNAPWPYVVAIIFASLAGVVAGPAWFVHAGNLAARAGSRLLPVEGRLLAVVSVIFLLLMIFMPSFDGPNDSLSMLAGAQLSQFGPPETFWDIRIDLLNGHDPHPFTSARACVPLWSAFLALRLLVVLRRAARRAQSSKIG